MTESNRLKNRFLRTFVLIGGVPLFVIAIIVSWLGSFSLIEKTQQLETETAHRIAVVVEDYFVDAVDRIAELERQLNFITSPKKEMERVFNRTLAEDDTFQSLFFLHEANGIAAFVDRTHIRPQPEHMDLKNMLIADQAKKARSELLGALQFDEKTGQPRMTIVRPVVNLREDEVTGVLVGIIRIDELWTLMRTVDVSDSRDVYITDTNGRMIGHRNPTHVLRGAELDGETFTGIRKGMHGNWVVMAEKNLMIAGQPMIVIAEHHLFDALVPTIRLVLITTAVLMLGIAIAILLANRTATQIVSPILRIADIAETVGKGNLSLRTNVTTDDEVGELGRSFDAMTENMQELLDKLSAEIGDRKQIELELLEHERFLDSIIENIPTMVFVKDSKNLNFVRFNKAGEDLLGISREDILGKNDYDLFPREQADFFTSRDREVLEKNKVLDIPEEFIDTSQGDRLTLHTRKIGIYDEEGNPVYLLGISVDITDQKKLKKELEDALKELELNNEMLENRVVERTLELADATSKAEAANLSKSQFLANMSHEIRTPMNGVIGMVDILTQMDLTPEQNRMIQTIRNSSFSLLRIIDDILDASKIEAGKIDVESVPVEITPIVEDVAKTLLPVADASKVRLALFVDPSVPDKILSDPMRLRQVLLNLLSNAVKFTKPKSSQSFAQVDFRVGLNADGQLLFTIDDNGIGMSEEVRKKLFLPFSQGEDTTTRQFGGTGLGLLISNNLVKLMGGEISLQSDPGIGSTFSVIMPCIPSDENTTQPDVSGLKILALSGDELHDERMKVYLAHHGSPIQYVADVSELKELLSHEDGPCIIMLADASAQENERIQKILTDESGQRKFLGFTAMRSERLGLVRPDYYVIQRYPVLPSDLYLGIAVLAGRKSAETLSDPDTEDASALELTVGKKPKHALFQKILLVEDNETNQDVIKRQLQILGYGVEVADDGQIGFDMWKDGQFDLILTDCHMPEMDGYEMTVEIRRHEKDNALSHVPIVAITANALKGESDRCLACGMDDYLSKPVELSRLGQKMKRWLSEETTEDLAISKSVENEIEDSDEDSPVLAPIDTSILDKIVGKNQGLQRQLLKGFVEPAIVMVDDIHRAFADGTVEEVGALGHKLKSSSRTIGANALADLCEELEFAGKSGDRTKVEALHNNLDGLFKDVLDYIEKV